MRRLFIKPIKDMQIGQIYKVVKGYRDENIAFIEIHDFSGRNDTTHYGDNSIMEVYVNYYDANGNYIKRGSNKCWEDDEDGLCLSKLGEESEILIGLLGITHEVIDNKLIELPKSNVGAILRGRENSSEIIGIGFRYSNSGASTDVFTGKGIVSMFSNCWVNIGMLGATHELCVENIETE